jgi:putative transposase
MVTPAARRLGVEHLVQGWPLSERRACRLIGVHRSVVRYEARSRDDEALRARLRALATEYPRYGYLMLHELLRREGLVQNRKRTYRLYIELGLQVRRRRRKRLQRPRLPLVPATRANQRWSMDFVSDQLATGRRFRVFCIVDDHTRECVGQLTELSISGERLTRVLDQIAETRSLPEAIVCDNGPEFTSRALFLWAQQRGVRLHFIQPGKPTQNAYVESFNGKFRDTCLNEHWFINLAEARRVIERWRRHYNEVRPHSSLGYLAPATFAEQAA